MTRKELPAPSRLRKLLRYNPDTGKLFWRPRPIDSFSTLRAYAIFKSRFAGKEAFTTDLTGYYSGQIEGITLRAHRVIWAMCHGEWPEHVIDHIDGNRKNNKLCNLRHTTQMNNCRNRKSHKKSTSQYTGVSFAKRRGKWQAQICGGNKGVRTKSLGFFDCEKEAAKAYDLAAKENYGEFARLNFPD